MYIVFYNGTDSYKEKILDIPYPVVIKGYQYNMIGKFEGQIKRIEFYPVILSSSGDEVIGPMFDSWTSP